MNRITTLIIFSILMTGMVSAQSSVPSNPGFTPGDLFYGVEQASESLELAVAGAPIIGSDSLQAKVRANHAAERLAEAEKLAKENRSEAVEKLMDRYSNEINGSITSARKSNQTELVERLRNVTQDQEKVLEQVQQKVPESAKKGVGKAIKNSRRQQEKLAQERGKPLREGKRQRQGSKTGKNLESGNESKQNNGDAGSRNLSENVAPEKEGRADPKAEKGNQTAENSSATGKTMKDLGTAPETEGNEENLITGEATGKGRSVGGPP